MKMTIRANNSVLAISLLVALWFGAASFIFSQHQQPDTLLMDQGSLAFARDSYAKGEVACPPWVKKLMKEAAVAVTAEIVSVMQKQQVPPSGDKHDFMSLAPYWWPDTTKPDGLPYIRRDGERNPEFNAYGDNERIDRMVDNVVTLGLAFAVSKDERFAERAIRQLTVWFLEPTTKMNPNLNFAQAVKGVNEGRGIGIIETYSFRHLIDAMILLKQSRSWTREVEEGLRSWFGEYLRWLLESPHGKDEAGWKNNHGSAYDVQTSCIALYLGKKDLVAKTVAAAGMKRIAVQIEPDGSQPLELERTKSWGYSIMNLDALIELARLGDRVGVDLWRFSTRDGRSIRAAIDFLLPYALGQKQWTWKQIVPFHPGRMYFSLRIAADKYQKKSYLLAARKVQDDVVQTSRTMFLVPPGR